MANGKLVKKQTLADKLLEGNILVTIKDLQFEVRSEPDFRGDLCLWDVFTPGGYNVGKFICHIRKTVYPGVYYTISKSKWGKEAEAFYNLYHHIFDKWSLDEDDILMESIPPRPKRIFNYGPSTITSEQVYSGSGNYKGD